MRNSKLLFLVHFFIIIIFIIPSYGADVAKIAILDIQKVIDFGKTIPGVSGIVIIKGENIGLWGDLKIVQLI